MWSILALLIQRLKVLWMPTVCILTGVFVADVRVYKSLLNTLGKLSSYLPRWFPEVLKAVVCVGYIALVVHRVSTVHVELFCLVFRCPFLSFFSSLTIEKQMKPSTVCPWKNTSRSKSVYPQAVRCMFSLPGLTLMAFYSHRFAWSKKY